MDAKLFERYIIYIEIVGDLLEIIAAQIDKQKELKELKKPPKGLMTIDIEILGEWLQVIGGVMALVLLDRQQVIEADSAVLPANAAQQTTTAQSSNTETLNQINLDNDIHQHMYKVAQLNLENNNYSQEEYKSLLAQGKELCYKKLCQLESVRASDELQPLLNNTKEIVGDFKTALDYYYNYTLIKDKDFLKMGNNYLKLYNIKYKELKNSLHQKTN